MGHLLTVRRRAPAHGVRVMLLALGLLAQIPDALAQPAARIVSTRGEVHIERADASAARIAQSGVDLDAGDTLITGNDGKAVVLLADETLLRLHRNTRFTLKAVDRSAGWSRLGDLLPAARRSLESVYELLRGELWLLNKNPHARIRIQSATLTAGVRGTEIGMRVAPDGRATIAVLEGQVLASNAQGAVTLGPGEAADAVPGAAPRKRLLANPEDAVQWVITPPPGLRIAAPGDTGLAAAWRAVDQGRLDDARALLEPDAGEQASAGRLSLRALVAILQGRAADAERASAQAVLHAPEDADAWVVRAYTLQSRLALDEAEAALRRALAIAPQHLTARLNLVEVLFGADRFDAARATLAPALASAPGDARVNAIAGFLTLADGQLHDALARFDAAIAADASIADAWLGRALALLRDAEIEPAFEAIAAATALEPRRALFYSYWARMLYTLGRHRRALDMTRRAAALDARDPTPVYLEAMILRDANRAGEAVRALNRAIALNDNRAVYRSRYLLDRDLAVKSVDLSVLYERLGLDAWARHKAIDAVKHDFANFSAHLFLAGAFAGDEDREINLQSEFLLARLLQPANANSFNTFNDYTTLLDRPSLGGELLAGVGGHGRTQGEAIAFGALPEHGIAFQAGAFHDATDGWHGANFERAATIAGVVKADVTRDDGVLLTLSSTGVREGDVIFPRFEHSAARSPEDRTQSDVRRMELGYRRRMGPDGNLLVYLARVDVDGELLVNTTTPIVPGFDLINRNQQRFERPRDQAQVQIDRRVGSHQLRAGWLHHAGDANAHVADRNFVNLLGTIIPLAALDTDTVNRFDTRLRSVYVQDTWSVNALLTLDAALYAERFENADPGAGLEWSQNEINPRLGAIIRPGPRDTVRIAAYRYLLPFVGARLDPTDIAGLAVFRNAREGALARELAVSWEREWDSGFASAGVFSLNASTRAASTDAFGNPLLAKFSARRRGLDLEANQLLGHGIGLSARYRLLDTRDAMLAAYDRREHRIDLGVRTVHASGWFGGATTTLRRMNFDRGRAHESIVNVDLELGYELPGKWGELRIEVHNLLDRDHDWITDRFSLVGEAPGRELFASFRARF